MPIKLCEAEKQVGPSDCSTSFGMYQVSPESPDAMRIAYIRYKEPPTLAQMAQPAEFWLCDRTPGKHREIAHVDEVYMHNGSCIQCPENNLLVLHVGLP